MKLKSIIAFLLLMAAGVQTVKAQKVIINFDDEQVVEYDVSHIKSMTFEEKEIYNEIYEINSYLAQLITDIIIQDTENPLFGSFNLSANSQSKLLIAFYGRPSSKVEFPTTDNSNYLKKSEALTDEDWSMLDGIKVFTLKANRFLVNEDETGKAYAGKVYVTINPSSVDATALQLQIVNSQDYESPVQLSPLRKSDTTLKNRRAHGAGNGFYEATAYVSKTDIEDIEFHANEEVLYYMFLDIREKIAEIAQNLDYYINHAVSLYPMANDIYQLICGTPLIQSCVKNLERNALKCPFKGISGNDQAVYSSYNLITTSSRALSMATDMYWFEENYPGEDFFGPFMFASNGGRGIKLLSEEKTLPTQLSADELILYPTTKTMELVVPIARKHIAITDVFKDGKSAKGGDADCLSHLRAANASDMFNSVIDGTVPEIEVTNIYPNYVYEIAYSVLDFDGHIATRKYYIEAK